MKMLSRKIEDCADRKPRSVSVCNLDELLHSFELELIDASKIYDDYEHD